MDSSKQKFPGFRYFKAGLRPFSRFIFWGPPTLIAIFLFSLWQYRTHPEWLGINTTQPEGSIDNLFGEKSEDTTKVLIGSQSAETSDLNELADSKLLDQGLIENSPAAQSPESLLEQLNASNDLKSILGTQESDKNSPSLNESSKLKENLKKTASNKLPELFMPLLPEIKPNSNKSEFSGKPLEIQKSVELPESALKTAMDKVFTSPSQVPPIGIPPVQPQSIAPSQSDNQTTLSQSQQINNQGTVQPYQNPATQPTQTYQQPQPYNPYPVQPSQNRTVQTYQQPYNPYPVYNPYPTAQQPRPTQTQPYQQPYNPYPVYNPYPAVQQPQPTQSQTQPYQQPSNNIGIQTPQFQQPIQVYQPGF